MVGVIYCWDTEGSMLRGSCLGLLKLLICQITTKVNINNQRPSTYTVWNWH